MKHNPKAITSAMQLYLDGEPLRNTRRSLQLLETQVSFKTVANWIEKYVAIMKEYVLIFFGLFTIILQLNMEHLIDNGQLKTLIKIRNVSQIR